MLEPVRPVVDGEDPLDPAVTRPRRGPIDPNLLRLAPALRRHLVVCAGLAVVTTLVVLTQAEVVGRELPRLIDGDLDAATPLAVVLVVIGLGRLVLRWVTEVSAARAIDGARTAITRRVVSHALVVDEPGAVVAGPARVTTLVTDGVDALDPWIRDYIPALCLAGILPLAAGARILLADVPSAVILLVAIPLIPVFMVLIGRFAEERTNRQWATLQHLAGHFHDVLVGLPTLRLFGQADAQVDGVRAVAERYRVAVMRTLRVAFLSAAAMELLAMLSIALVAVTVGYRLTVGALTLQTALIVLLLTPECSLPIRRVGAAFHAAQAGTDAADEIHEVLAASTSPDGPVEVLGAPEPGTAALRILEATVVDAERGRRVGPVVADIAAGSLVALVGASGAGKSTMLDVIRCRVPLHRGRVELDGVDVSLLSRAARSAAISWIPQLPDPVGADVRSIVSAGSGAHAVDPSLVDDVLSAVDLGALADRDPGELSGGERQRLAVARGVLRCRTSRSVRILLADEPTSHLDPGRAAMVIDVLRSVATAGTTVVVATHDPKLVHVADQVVVLDDDRQHATPADAVPVDATPAGDRVGGAEVGDTGRLSGDVLRSQPSEDAATVGEGSPSTPTGGIAEVADAPAGASGADLEWFRRMAAPLRWRLVGARALGVATELCSVGLAGTAAWMLVRASQGSAFSQLAVAAVAVRTFAIGKGVLRYAERIASHDTTFRLLANVRGAVVGRLGRIAPAGVPGMERGDVMARVVDDVDRLADQELRVMGPMVSGLTVGIVVVAAAAVAAIGFGLAYAAVVAVVAVALPAATRVLAARAVGEQAGARAAVAGAALDLVEHADELASTGAADAFRDRISAGTAAIGRADRSLGVRIGFVEGVAAFAAPALAASVVVIDRVLGARVDGPVLGVLVLVPFALMEVLAPLLHAGERQASVLTAAHRLRAVLEAPDPVDEPDEPARVEPDPWIELDDVALRWPTAASPVLAGIDLRLDPGDRLRVDGPSGAGKSTLAAALVRFIDVDRGRYLIAGVDAARAGGDQVREIVTWCQQVPWLAATSLRENLRLAAPDASDEELWSALDAVHLSDWAVSLPDGLATAVGRDGDAMSGGQRQRLALARVLLAGHRVVVLDEPTAHLDAETAARVQRDLLDALEDRTVIVLGHGTTSDADTDRPPRSDEQTGIGEDGRAWARLDISTVGAR